MRRHHSGRKTASPACAKEERLPVPQLCALPLGAPTPPPHQDSAALPVLVCLLIVGR